MPQPFVLKPDPKGKYPTLLLSPATTPNGNCCLLLGLTQVLNISNRVLALVNVHQFSKALSHLLLPKQWRPRKPRKKEVPNKSDPEWLRDHRFRILRPNRRKILCGSASTAWLGRPWQAEVASTKNALQWQSGRQLPGGPGRSKEHKFPVQGHRYSSKHFACVS